MFLHFDDGLENESRAVAAAAAAGWLVEAGWLVGWLVEASWLAVAAAAAGAAAKNKQLSVLYSCGGKVE